MTETLCDIVEGAKDDLREWAEDNPDEWDADRYISDTCNAATPVYDADLIRLALENGDLRPDNWIGPIASAVYDHVYQQLDAEWGVIVEEREEAESEE